MNFRYNYEKNSQLLKTRGIGFEEVIQSISEGNVLDIRKHPNKITYPNQKKYYFINIKNMETRKIFK